MNTRVTPPTTRLLRRLGRALKRHLPAAVAGDDTGVHQARVTSRRLREAVPVLATGLKGSGAGKATRKIRKLTRALGAVRELDVTLLLLDELSDGSDVPRGAVEDVRTYVVHEREAGRSIMLKRLAGIDPDKLGRRLASVEEALAAATDEPWRRVLGTRLIERSEKLVVAMNAAGHMYSPDRLHEVRIAAKKLRYGLELASDSGVPRAASHVRTIKRVQDLLGTLHDLQVLQSHIAAAQSAQAADEKRREALDALAAHVEARCRHLHGKYLTTSQELRGVPDAIRTDIVPRLIPAAPRRRPLKMGIRAEAPEAARAAQKPRPRIGRGSGQGVRTSRAGR